MKFQRTITIFLVATSGILAVAVIKALVTSSLAKLPPANVMLFAASAFGLLAVLLDRALLQNLLTATFTLQRAPDVGPGPDSTSTVPSPGQTGPPDSTIEQARWNPIVFREICPPSSATGLSFYGGAPVGPPKLTWPRNKSDDAPLSFLMQWECIELAGQDVTGLLPREGVLYLFADLGWSDFRFVHAPGPVKGWRALPIPSGLPSLYGKGGAHEVPYCSPLIASENQDVPCLLPKWPFQPLAFAFPAAPGATDDESRFWNEGGAVGEALLRLQHPEGVPPAKRLDKPKSPFGRPFAAFPHDYASVRVVTAKVLHQLRWPTNRLLGESSAEDREAKFERWRNEARERYGLATKQHPATRVEQSISDELWHWIEGLEPVLQPGWDSLVEECINVSLGMGTEAAEALPAHLVVICSQHHRLASAYLHEEYPDRSKPDALATWERRKAEGSLREVRTLHAPCPNHMFGPPSFVQGYVDEYLNDWMLLLELSSRQSIGHEFGEGVFQFMIRPTDLGEGRFDEVVLVASAY